MKNNNEYYLEINQKLLVLSSELACEFQQLLMETDDKNVIFIWLQGKSDAGLLSKDLEDLITDFFFSTH